MTAVLAFDLGGSSLRLAIVSESRDITQMVRREMRIPGSISGEFEVDPEDWWIGFCKGCEELEVQGADLSRVRAIAGCGFTRTQVPLGRDGNVVHPAITFQDSRGAKALDDFLGRASPSLKHQVPSLSPFHPIARMLWLKKNKPAIWNRVATILEPKDYINYRLTKSLCSDGISMNATRSCFDAIDTDPSSKAALGIARTVMPQTISPFDTVGHVSDGLPGPLAKLSGRPVICGSTDTWTCVLGSGALNPGAAYSISGTTDVSGLISAAPHACEGLLTVEWGPGHWQLGGPSQGAATRLTWAVDRFMPGKPLERAVEESFAHSTSTPLFLPYLEGERTPFWDNDLRGAFLGVESRHTPHDFVRAVAEGINLLSRIILERAEDAAGEPAAHVCFSGGLSKNHILCQLKADVLNRRVFVARRKETGLIGAASLPFAATGDIAGITGSLMADGTWYEPQPEARATLDQRFEIFKSATAAMTGISHRIADLA